MSKSRPVPTAQQALAASPQLSVWVSANAGSGKTKVLTDRVLRLLLEGVAPHRILCLTYTKAAAAEMSVRIQNALREWVVTEDASLTEALRILLGATPDTAMLCRARKLFAQVVDHPEGIRIHTIHALCQSLLRRFALEAGVSPHFRLMGDQEASLLLEEAKHRFFAAQLNDADGTTLREAVRLVASHVSETTIHELLDTAITDRGKMAKVLALSPEMHREYLCQSLSLNPDFLQCSAEDLVKTFFRYDDLDLARWRLAYKAMMGGTPSTDIPIAEGLKYWMQSAKTEADAQKWCEKLLTQKQEIRKTLFTKKVFTAYPEIADILPQEATRAYHYTHTLLGKKSVALSQAAWLMIHAMLAIYHQLKLQRGLLDYEDLIAETSGLLSRPNVAPWVLFKLDGGIDHILVDEAQDTSRIQWQLVDALANEFFSGHSAGNNKRTLFVVGDEKQSIYSFQGADPTAFAEMKQYFAARIRAAEKPFENISLLLSYRSTAPVLQAVDAIFAQESTRQGVIQTESEILHTASRKEAGRVELWPLIAGEDEEDNEAYTLAEAKEYQPLAYQLLAEKIADTLSAWLNERRYLHGRKRTIRAGDIMILVRQRGPLFYALIRSLKSKNIPLAGADRLSLSGHIAVQDLLALAEFLLLPEDDLSLCCLLKSPLFCFSEEDIYTLCQGRESSVWAKLKQQTAEHFTHAVAKLSRWLDKVDYLPPYELFSMILEAEEGRIAFAARMGDEVQDPLSEFLSLALEYEQLHQPALQGFLQWFRQSDIEIKRDMEQTQDAVRILTIHGSKGLEAPIIILPDTTGTPVETPRLLVQPRPPCLFWNFSTTHLPESLKSLQEERKTAALYEYRRLFYVALTRAADELYIAGYQGKRAIPENCWYRMAESGLKPIMVENTDGIGVLSDEPATPPLSSTTTESASDLAENKVTPIPAWIKQPPPAEPIPPKPLIPSRPSVAEPDAEAPAPQFSALKRGKAIHLLLEIIPDIPEALRESSAQLLLQQHWPEGDAAAHSTVWHEVSAILHHPEFAEVFAKNSQAEVPITALVTEADGTPRIISGQIDRLRILPESILLVDYKTNRHIPQTPQTIPAFYKQQMTGYARALRAIYPHHTIRAAILWTSGPELMILDDLGL